METRKTIEVRVNTCDICGKETTRRTFSYTKLNFCINHKWVEDILRITQSNKVGTDNVVRFLKEELDVHGNYPYNFNE